MTDCFVHWYATWEPPWGYQDVTVIAHEMGHGFGLPHSSGNYGQTYDNQWDVMSDTWTNCGNSRDPVFGCLGQHTNSYHKNLEGWIGARRAVVALFGQATLTLEQLALPPAGSTLMAQIPINGSSTRFYTVEARRKVGYDVKLPGPAVIIHEVDTSRSIPAHVVDIDNNGNTGDAGAQWLVGETFTDAANSISVSVDSATATGFVVTICNACNQPTPSPTPTSTPTSTPTATPTSAPTATPTSTPTATPPGFYLQRANSGGANYTDTGSLLWAADKAFATGSWGYTGGSAKSTTAAVAGTNDDLLYQKRREAPGEYRFTLPNGTYQVQLKFAEFDTNKVGDRKMTIRLESTTVEAALDIYALAGRATALDKAYQVTVADGILNITFVKNGGKKNPIVSAVEVESP